MQKEVVNNYEIHFYVNTMIKYQQGSIYVQILKQEKKQKDNNGSKLKKDMKVRHERGQKQWLVEMTNGLHKKAGYKEGAGMEGLDCPGQYHVT